MLISYFLGNILFLSKIVQFQFLPHKQVYTVFFKKKQFLVLSGRPFSMRFRSVFGFLKKKAFINGVLMDFLRVFKINPRKGQFVGVVSLCKKYNVGPIIRYFTNSNIVFAGFFLDLPNITGSYYRLLVYTNIRVNRVRYLLFRYKIYNYTTPPLIKVRAALKWYYSRTPEYRDLRFLNNQRLAGVINYNFSVFSTYIWKTIT